MQFLKDIIRSWSEKADEPAVIDDTESLTGRQAAAAAKATIDMLTERGTAREDIIAFTGSDTLAKFPMNIGILLAGRVSSALAPFASAPARQHMLDESGAKLVLVDATTRRMAEEVMTADHRVPIVEEESFIDFSRELPPDELTPYAERISGEDWMTLRYTSGSTGEPKGMYLRAQSTEDMTYNYINPCGGVGVTGRFLCTMPLSSLEGNGMAQMFATAGLVPCVYRGRATPAGILSELERYRITDFFLPSSQLTAIVRDPAFELTDLSCLRSVVYAGQTISPTDLSEAIAAIGGDKLVQVYGQTESGMLSALGKEDHQSGDPEILSSAGVIFSPTDVEIRDDNGDVVPDGMSGEIYVRGGRINAERWTPERTHVSIVAEDGWMATGDLARRVNNRLWITGRTRDMVLYRGYNVPTRPIEEALVEYPGVRDAVVHPVEDPYAGEVVFAWLRLRDGATIEKEAVADFIQQRVSKWSRPSYIQFVETLPQRSALKKTDKVTLRDWGEELVRTGAVELLPQPQIS
ncbi:MAG: class I adenylate-forming enzyme family protein [Propionibacterium acidifaciens]